MSGVAATPPGCQPTASAAEEASSQSGIPNAGEPTFREVDAWLRSMLDQGEDRIWRGAVKALDLLHLWKRGIEDAEALMEESGGVYGLHLNGDHAPWDELRTGGRFEEWLFHFDCAASRIEARRVETPQEVPSRSDESLTAASGDAQ